MRTEDLLHLDPTDALIAMVNWENNTEFRPGSLIAGRPRAGVGRLTKVTLAARRQAGLLDVVPDPGEIDFQFNRLDIGQHFSGVLGGFRPRMPVSTQVLVDELSRRMEGQKFYINDFVAEYIDRENGQPYILKAHPDSLRWMGQLEVTLGNWPDLAVYLGDATPAMFHAVPERLELAEQPVGFSFINATPSLPIIQTLVVNSPAQSHAPLVQLVRNTLARSPQYVSVPETAWVTSATPGPYNLYNAVVVNAALPVASSPWRHPVNANLTHVVHIRLDLAFCTNFSVADIYLPYQRDHTPISLFDDEPRFRQSGVISPSDASPWNKQFNAYRPGDLLTNFAAAGLLISGSVPWYTRANEKSRTNLYGAAVQYNGQRRTSDLRPATPGLNRVLVVTVDETYNVAYEGAVSFHYRAPIMIVETAPAGKVGTAYNFATTPSEGTGPYTLTATGLPPGLSVAGTAITGTPTQAGGFTPTLTIRDASGTSVDYQVRITVQA